MNASGRLNTCKSNGKVHFGGYTSGARVSNAYTTYLQKGDSPGKPGVIPHNISLSKEEILKLRRLKMGVRPIS